MRTYYTVLLGMCLCVVLAGCADQKGVPLTIISSTGVPEPEIKEPPGISFGQSSHPGSPLSAPVGVTASQGIAVGEILITWDEDLNAEKYYVYMLDEKSTTWQGVGQISRPPAIISDIKADEEYFYSIAGVAQDGREGPWSKVVMGWAAAESQTPANVRASRGTDPDTILLTWDSVPDAAGYKIYMSSGDGQYTHLRDWQGTSVRIPASAPKKPYRFKVSSISTNNKESVFSDFSEGWTAAPPEPCPDAPSGFSASDGSDSGEISLKWNRVASASAYEIYRSDSSVGPFLPIAVVNSTTYTDGNVALWDGFWYKVSAVDTAGRKGEFCNHDGGWTRRYRN